MEQYLKLFKNQAEYDSSAEKPPVSHIVEEVDVIMPVSFDNQYLTIEALTNGSMTKVWDGGDIYCSLDDGKTWQSMADGVVFNLEAGQKMLCKNSADPGGSGIGAFSGTCDVKIYGNIMSMAYGDDFKGKDSLAGKEYAFKNLFTFIKNKALSIENVILPATTLSKGCYYSLFNSMTRIRKAPKLPAIKMEEECYYSMFSNCTSLTEAPELPATSLGGEAYSYMFMGCTALEIAPELSAPAPGSYSYYEMFYDCTKLKYIKMTATNISAQNCLQYWVHNVASTGTFVKKSSTSIPSGESGIPNGWTVENV